MTMCLEIAGGRTAPTVPAPNSNRPGRRPNINPTAMDLMMSINTTLRPAGATCHREEAENYDRVLVDMGRDWRLIECRDNIQFILQRKSPGSVVGVRWRNVRYHRTRDTLFEAATRSGIDLSAKQAATIRALPAICGQEVL